ncbi:DUF2336 domain-containing protein [Methylobacterium haplocladii]|uniref:DUF2336 domain-containing protein n=1 Tax=Methylobacterium haplocladii TaxID=1176176 RepID=A0A512IUB5_9HYPH|nr:DUF2336 domain-containing protein [Methylobacterium haplocladii]GEP01281.1 hypothetical protein MHA02_36680 [Methylobacterium haplocladii]GJD86124.1 hypothetical protein HPGCJGGD_4021 [Methylobacterium haplocladii]
MTLRQFLLATQTAPAERRAEAAAALARAYCHGSLAPEAAWEAKTALLGLLDDGSALVRRALAEACASADTAPRPLIVALASDQPDIACLVLARSPVLMDADLVDCAAIGCETTRSAVAGRADVSKPVAAALAEVAGAPSLTVLARNRHAEIGTAALLRMVERHGHDALLREALLARPGLGLEVRHAIAARVAEALSSFGLASGWLNRERGERVNREARDCAALSLSDEAGESGLARLVSHLRAQGQLNAGLILRAILSLRMPFAEAALADLSGLSRARVAGLMFEPRGAGFAALHRRAGLPVLLLPAIQAALSAWREAATGGADIEGPRLARRMIERALTACEDMPFAESRSLMALLARFEAEAAREEAREHARAVAAETEREAILRIEAAQREAANVLPEALPPPSPEPLHCIAAEVVQSDRLSRVLDELPDAIIASYHAERERRQAEEASAVLDGLSDALMTSFLASREVPSVVTVTADEPTRPAPMLVAVQTRAAQDAPDLVASLISESILASYRGDRERVRIAA